MRNQCANFSPSSSALQIFTLCSSESEKKRIQLQMFFFSLGCRRMKISLSVKIVRVILMLLLAPNKLLTCHLNLYWYDTFTLSVGLFSIHFIEDSHHSPSKFPLHYMKHRTPKL